MYYIHSKQLNKVYSQTFETLREALRGLDLLKQQGDDTVTVRYQDENNPECMCGSFE